MIKLEKLLKISAQGISCVGDFLKKRAFCGFIVLLLLAFLAAGLVYYFYVLNIALPANEEPVEINIELYKKTLEQQKNRQASIQQGIEQKYPDIFR